MTIWLVLSIAVLAASGRATAEQKKGVQVGPIAPAVYLPFIDNFEDGNIDDWTVAEGEVTASALNSRTGSYAMRLYDGSSGGAPWVKLIMNTRSARIGVEFWEWTNNYGWNGGSVYELTTSLADTSGWSFQFGAQAYTGNHWKYINTQDKWRWANQNLWQTNVSDFPVPVVARAGSWHRVKIEISGPEGYAQFWYDGQYKGQISIKRTSQPIKYFTHYVSWSTPTGTTNYVDDFKAYELGSSGLGDLSRRE